MGNEYSRITKTDTEQYSTYSSRVISRPTVLSNTKIILLGSKKQPCTILDTPEEKITQVSLHRDGSIFYSSISHNVYVTSTTEHDLLPYIPKEGTFVTKVASSYSKTVFLFNTGQASFFNLETRTIQPVQIKHRRFKFQDVAIGDIYVYLVQQGGKEVYRIRTSETCDSLHFKKIAKHAGKIAKIGGGEKHMSVLTTRGHAFFAGCTSICLHTNMHSCENRLVPDKFFHRNKRTFLDMAVAKNYSFFIPSHERDVVYCVYHEHLSYTTLRGVSSIFASGNRFFYQTNKLPLQEGAGMQVGSDLSFNKRLNYAKHKYPFNIIYSELQSKSRIVSFTMDQDGPSYLIIEDFHERCSNLKEFIASTEFFDIFIN